MYFATAKGVNREEEDLLVADCMKLCDDEEADEILGESCTELCPDDDGDGVVDPVRWLMNYRYCLLTTDLSESECQCLTLHGGTPEGCNVSQG